MFMSCLYHSALECVWVAYTIASGDFISPMVLSKYSLMLYLAPWNDYIQCFFMRH